MKYLEECHAPPWQVFAKLKHFLYFCKMLRRKLTRIQLSRDDMEEYETVKKQWAEKKQTANTTNEAKLTGQTVPGRLNDAERIAEVHRRIGYKPDNVPSDRTERML